MYVSRGFACARVRVALPAADMAAFMSAEALSGEQARLRKRIDEKKLRLRAIDKQIAMLMERSEFLAKTHALHAHQCGVARALYRDTLELISDASLKSAIENNGVHKYSNTGGSENTSITKLVTLDKRIGTETNNILACIKETRSVTDEIEKNRKICRSLAREIASTVYRYNTLFGPL